MKAIVWSKKDCPNCDKAKALLKTRDIEFEERKIGLDWTTEQLLEQVPSARSVPQVFLNGTHIGGYTELQKYFEETAGGYGEDKL